MTITCHYCTKTYEFRSGHRGIKFCSKECYQSSRRLPIEDVIRGRRLSHEKCKDAQSAYNRLKYQRLRATVIQAYGGRCACCGESCTSFLTIEHTLNDGAQERALGLRAAKLLNYIIRNGFPPTYSVACFNCNSGREVNGGVCPHKEALWKEVC